jgi:hypothetical protein
MRTIAFSVCNATGGPLAGRLRRLLLVAFLAVAQGASAAALDAPPHLPEISALTAGSDVPPAITVATGEPAPPNGEFDLRHFAASLYATVAGGAAAAASPAAQSLDADRTRSVPVPAALWLFGSGLGALGYLGRRRLAARRRNAAERSPTTRYRARPHGADSALRARLHHAAAMQPCRPPEGAAGDGAGGPVPVARRAPVRPCGTSVQGAFEQMAQVLAENPEVVLGRKFGRACVKLGKRAFIACDGDVLAFRVGTGQAARLLAAIPAAAYWNPKQGPKPKHSWLTHAAGNAEALVTLVAAAYEHALQCPGSQSDYDTDDERRGAAQTLGAT